MNELAQHIESLLLENDCIIIPGFGGFVAHYTPATWVKEENLFLPPTRTIGFNSQLKLNDGVLVQSYMSVHNTSFSDATRIVKKEVTTLIQHLHEEGKVDLENIGEIHYNIYGNFEFAPYDHKITTPFLYGLDSLKIQELEALQYKEKLLIPVANPAKGKKTYEISINRTLLRNAVATVAAFILFFTFSTPVENTYIQKNNYAQLMPTELFEQIEQQSVAVTPIITSKIIARHSQNTPTSQTKEATIEKVKHSKTIAVKEIKVSKHVTPAVITVVKPQADRPFHIIVAGGISLKDAETITEKLKTSGFTEAITLNNSGKIRVSINSFNNREEANSRLLELRKNETYKNAWLLAK